MKKLLAIVLALVTSLSMAVPAMAQPSESHDVDTSVVIGNSGSVPWVCAKFETPDMVTVDENGDPVPGMQLIPTPYGKTIFKVYAVVGAADPASITEVDAAVHYANGDLKFELRASKNGAGWTGVRTWPDGSSDTTNISARQVIYNAAANQGVDMNGDCTPETTVANAIDLLNAAGSRIWYGANPAGGNFDKFSVKSDLAAGKQIMIELKGDMDFHQPAERYSVYVTATNGVGTSNALANWFDYTSIVSLLIDFSQVTFEGAGPSTWGYDLGDGGTEDVKNAAGLVVPGGDGIPDSMQTPDRPTVWNVGNDDAMIQVEFTRMVKTGDLSKWIDKFDAALGNDITNYDNLMDADVATILLDGAAGDPVHLVPCHPTQIDFSVHPINAVSGTYTGDVTITILHYAP